MHWNECPHGCGGQVDFRGECHEGCPSPHPDEGEGFADLIRELYPSSGVAPGCCGSSECDPQRDCIFTRSLTE